MSLKAIYRKALAGTSLAESDIRYIQHLPDDRLGELLEYAHSIRTACFDSTVGLCAIVNAKSGTCSEDCAFCAQSGHHGGESPEYPLLPPEQIAAAGLAAKRHGVTRFGVVASGKMVGESDLAGYAEAVRRVAAQGLKPDLSPGILDCSQLKALKAEGLEGYHHNLETSASYFPKICTTHAYEEDIRAVRAGLKAGLYVCSGGIFGIGESWDDRVELALLLRELGVPSVPMNFLHPIPGTPLEGKEVLSPEEALRIVALFRFLLPDRALRICGGRVTVFGEKRKRELLRSGANGLMVGDYLTTRGSDVVSDLTEIDQADLVPECSVGKRESGL
ncbi:biotin synthase BioB [Pseudodesulfovibrio piezophilus]|uniref:Biotin synthase n=1 Tax=Pseudodesulfovibrio piezophilus (strain DSM 21447 / JCM 15486 / C1TLV30) TaxID=1322246 RepID=M1WM37_PSEP2|nr:biotin synthase BioB [Pseudodesulfovibrio piezophilus]CCH48925.1 Biotin synthase [Pseudodesulfovibrio piezophilus C1TLV30]